MSIGIKISVFIDKEDILFFDAKTLKLTEVAYVVARGINSYSGAKFPCIK